MASIVELSYFAYRALPMLYANLARYYLTQRAQMSGLSSFISLLRCTRGMLFHSDHQEFCKLDIYRNYVMSVPNRTPFLHLSSRDYLIKNLPTRNRVECALTHYRFEDRTFDAAYKAAVYANDGLTLWQHGAGNNNFLLRLKMTTCIDAGGDLIIALTVDGKTLHQLSFSWIEGAIVGSPYPLVPLITQNLRCWGASNDSLLAFEQCFPNNSPSFFCFAAIQGLALALGMRHVLAVNSTAQIAYSPLESTRFLNAYDKFWKVLGGDTLRTGFWVVKLPFYLKPMTEITSKHRKRTALRREYWRAIGDSARKTLQGHLQRSIAKDENGARLREMDEI